MKRGCPAPDRHWIYPDKAMTDGFIVDDDNSGVDKHDSWKLKYGNILNSLQLYNLPVFLSCLGNTEFSNKEAVCIVQTLTGRMQ